MSLIIHSIKNNFLKLEKLITSWKPANTNTWLTLGLQRWGIAGTKKILEWNFL